MELLLIFAVFIVVLVRSFGSGQSHGVSNHHHHKQWNQGQSSISGNDPYRDDPLFDKD